MERAYVNVKKCHNVCKSVGIEKFLTKRVIGEKLC